MNQAFEEVRADFGIPLGSMDNLIGLRPYFRADQLRESKLRTCRVSFTTPG